MNLSNLKPAAGSVQNKFRKGRGEGSGNGLTAGWLFSENRFRRWTNAFTKTFT